jgi:peptide deformylase
MALLTVLEYPDKRLRNKALPVTQFDAALQRIVADMFETMYAEDGVGLAATQVNIQQRIVVIDVSTDRKSPLCLINPEITSREGTQYEYEGCISFPTVYDRVERAAKVHLRALDVNGNAFEVDAEELLAICLQHEIDHLDGILFVDHLSRLKRDRLCKKLEKARQQAAT